MRLNTGGYWPVRVLCESDRTKTRKRRKQKKNVNRWCNRYSDTDVIRRMRRNTLLHSCVSVARMPPHNATQYRSSKEACITSHTCNAAHSHTIAPHRAQQWMRQRNCQQQRVAWLSSNWHSVLANTAQCVCPTTMYLNISYESQYRFIHTTDKIDAGRSYRFCMSVNSNTISFIFRL